MIIQISRAVIQMLVAQILPLRLSDACNPDVGNPDTVNPGACNLDAATGHNLPDKSCVADTAMQIELA